MRIIGGSARGRTIKIPRTDQTRPITDMAREAVFDVLGDVEGLTMLDAYAGSGAFGLEAISRGVSKVIGIESGSEAAQCIFENAEKLGFEDRYYLEVMTAEAWLQAYKTRFNLITAGPPFKVFDWSVMQNLAKHLSKNGVLVANHPRYMKARPLNGLSLYTSRRYGDNNISFYKKDHKNSV